MFIVAEARRKLNCGNSVTGVAGSGDSQIGDLEIGEKEHEAAGF